MHLGAQMDGRTHWPDGSPVLGFARRLLWPPGRVWERLVDPVGLAEWLGPSTIEPEVGGRVVLSLFDQARPVEGRVLRVEADRLLEHTWGRESSADGRVRWRLTPLGGGTRLALTHAVGAVADVPWLLATWHLRLDLLLASFEIGTTVWLPERFDRLRRHYAAAVVPLAAGGLTGRSWVPVPVGSARRRAASGSPESSGISRLGELQQEVG